MHWKFFEFHTTGIGGAIQFTGAHLIVKNSSFSENQNQNGGAIFVGANDEHGSIVVEIESSRFYNNSGHNFGGSLYFHSDIKKLAATISNVKGFRNYANFSI
jgi:hypothetical protein